MCLQQHSRPAPPVTPVDRNVSRKLHHPSHERKRKQLLLAYPFHFPREMGNNGNIGQRLMIAHDDIGTTWIGDLFTRQVDAPCRVDSRHGYPESAKPASGAVAYGIPVEQTNDAKEREPEKYEGYNSKPNPKRSKR